MPELLGKLSADSLALQIIPTALQMARILQLKVVAEGVDTAEQLAYLSDKVDEMQGNALHPAMPAETFGELLCSTRRVSGSKQP
jgi:EAL domain-containing protein (putative c-di-GMP-specific phosphodiesterase class I)